MGSSAFQNALANKWMGLSLGMWMQACGGISYVYSLYSADLKHTLGYNQEMIDGLGTSKDIGGNVGIVSGLLIDVTSAPFVLLVGGLLHFSFYMLLYLAAVQQISPSYWQMCAIIMLGTNGATWFNTAVLVTCMRNFPSDRGVVVGLLKGFIGLSGAIFTQVYTAVYAPSTAHFLLFCATVPPLVALLSMLVIRPVEAPKQKDESDKSNFTLLYVAGVMLAFYLMAVILIQDFMVISKSMSRLFMFFMLAILLCPGLIVGCQWTSKSLGSAVPTAGKSFIKYTDRKSPLHQFKHVITVPAGPDNLEASKGLSNFPLPETPSKSKLRLGNDHNVLQALATEDFWLLFFAMGCGTGSGLTAINNLAQMAESLNSKSIGAFVALVSVWNFLGRLASGYISEWFVKNYGTPRPLFLLIVQAVMAFAHILFASSVPAMLYVASILVGLAHGAHWTLMVATSSELFGLRHFGALYNTLSISATIGSYLLSVKLAGYMYDRQTATAVVAEGLQSGRQKCVGPQCFRQTFVIMSLVCVIGCMALTRLISRTSSTYRDIHNTQKAKDQLRYLSRESTAQFDILPSQSLNANAQNGVKSPLGGHKTNSTSDIYRYRKVSVHSEDLD
ncbi:hypothetical protein O6H91_09G066900 [Diphasiastrum complanatum]|uniref:Uncharacterized protein n=2 Tax=Diphasiastrum complanatum TaxID=34168 RepID=A0ACC2CQD1_DIPCM|nr:hypothetical protein O6H91_09G066900 [Diphasiastrum complanatum]KAJ7544166.1 hypothetical protein O6H91_09G066900 [Diphasiastrum complanatum]